MTDQEIEKEIQEKGLNAPRVTPEHIQETIASEHYFTAEDGVIGLCEKHEVKKDSGTFELTKSAVDLSDKSPISLLTFCVLVLKNGFTVTGESACASHENFDAEIGRKIARQNAVQKIWMLEGYLLKQRLFERDEHQKHVANMLTDICCKPD